MYVVSWHALNLLNSALFNLLDSANLLSRVRSLNSNVVEQQRAADWVRSIPNTNTYNLCTYLKFINLAHAWVSITTLCGGGGWHMRVPPNQCGGGGQSWRQRHLRSQGHKAYVEQCQRLLFFVLAKTFKEKGWVYFIVGAICGFYDYTYSLWLLS